mgnify:CR=1 FL=1
MSARGIPRQAVILVGGEGTRLRPVTSRVPKPVAPVVERPFVAVIADVETGAVAFAAVVAEP